MKIENEVKEPRNIYKAAKELKESPDVHYKVI